MNRRIVRKMAQLGSFLLIGGGVAAALLAGGPSRMALASTCSSNSPAETTPTITLGVGEGITFTRTATRLVFGSADASCPATGYAIATLNTVTVNGPAGSSNAVTLDMSFDDFKNNVPAFVKFNGNLGGDGGDTISLIGSANNNDFFVGLAGTEPVIDLDGNNVADVTINGARVTSMVGGAGDDTLNAAAPTFIGVTPWAQPITLNGGSGTDSITGGTGADTLMGGTGGTEADFVRYNVNYANPGVWVNFPSGFSQIQGGAFVTDMISEFENMMGSNGNDFLWGNGSSNRFDALDGVDQIQTNDGDDLVNAGSGNDSIFGGTGIDTINGGAGDDVINGADNDDVIHGDGDNDTISGGAGLDQLFGDLGNDTIDGGAGNDTIDGGAGTDRITFQGAGSAVAVNLGSAVTLDGTAFDANKAAGVSSGTDGVTDVENADGTSSNDTLIGSSANNVLNGLDGDDRFYGGVGNDTLRGGNDTTDTGVNDRVTFEGEASNVTASLANGTASSSGSGSDTMTGIEDLTGGLAGDTLTGNNVANRLAGGGGTDALVGNDGDDTLTGGTENDTLDGGNGNDTLIGSENDDILKGGAGDDALIGGTAIATASGRDKVDYSGTTGVGVTVNLQATGPAPFAPAPGFVGNIQFAQGAGNDSLAGIADVIGTDQDDTLLGDDNDNALTGAKGVDIITGNGGNDDLDGGAGNDTLRGSAGDDDLIGGDHDDILFTGTGTNTADGGLGVDQINYSDQAGAVIVNLGPAATVSGTLVPGTSADLAGADADTALVGIEDIVGSSQNDLLVGSSGANVIDGGSGNDVLSGEDGNDTLIGNAGIDTADFSTAGAAVTATVGSPGSATGAGADTLNGIENLTGSTRNDTLTGDGAANLLIGWDGDDVLVGAGGDDGLIGGKTVSTPSGLDTVDYQSAPSAVNVDLSQTLVPAFTFNPPFAPGGNHQFATGGAGNDLLAGITNVIGSASNDVITGSTAANTLTGLAGDDTIHGGDGVDQIAGGSGVDTLNGNGGNDTITGGLNNDFIDGGADNDTLAGDEGDDTISGQAGTDTLTGGAGNDDLDGGADGDNLNGGTDDDSLIGGPGNDQLAGDFGNDTLSGDQGDDTFSGGPGRDIASFASASGGGVELNLGPAVNLSGVALLPAARARAAAGGNSGAIDTLATIEDVEGSGFADVLVGDGAANIINGGIGDDRIVGGAGDDFLNGDDGIDTVDYSLASSGVTVSLATNKGGQSPTEDTYTSIENVTGSDLPDHITGNIGINILDGRAANDTITGGDSNDTITGGDGNDTIVGGLGDDLLFGGSLIAGSGVDTVDYSSTTSSGVTVNLAVALQDAGGAGQDTLNAFRHVVGSSFADVLTGDGAGNNLFGLGGNDLLTGNAGIDTLDGGADEDSLSGGEGNDNLIGGTGTDVVSFQGYTNIANPTLGAKIDLRAGKSFPLTPAVLPGDIPTASGVQEDTLSLIENILGSGNADILIGDSVSNSLDGGGGTGVGDTVSYETAPSSVLVDLTSNTASGSGTGNDSLSSISNVIGSPFGDSLTGNDFANILSAEAGSDTLVGNGGNDVLRGGTSTDTVSYANAPFAVTVNLSASSPQATGSGTGSDALDSIENVTGSPSADTLTGKSDANVLLGLGGNDFLVGLAGDDTLDGGDGTDTILYSASFFGVRVNLAGTTSGTTPASSASGIGFFGLLSTGTDTLLSVEDVIGSQGNDEMTGGAGPNHLDGGAGIDTVSYAISLALPGVAVDLAAGTGGGGGVGSDALDFIENVIGSAGNDSLRGTNGNNAMLGLGGDDSIVGLDGADSMDGGAGYDTLDYSEASGGVNVDLLTPFPQQTQGAGFDYIVLNSFEKVVGSSFNDTLTGSGTANEMIGGAGDDVIAAGAGADIVSGGPGDDLLKGGPGNDQLTAGPGNDTLVGGPGNDTENGEAGNDRFMQDFVTNGSDTLIGGEGNDTADYGQRFSAFGVTVILDGAPGDGSAGENDNVGSDNSIENVSGGAGNDVLTGNLDANILNGGGGNDQLDGAQGRDFENGDAGDDTFNQGTLTNGGDVMTGGSGVDSVNYGGRSAAVTVRFNNIADDGEAGEGDSTPDDIEGATGGGGNDVFQAGTGTSRITFTGGQGNDSLTGSNGPDLLRGGDGTDTLVGGAGADEMFGDGGDDLLFANDAAPDVKIDGGAGSNDFARLDAVFDDFPAIVISIEVKDRR